MKSALDPPWVRGEPMGDCRLYSESGTEKQRSEAMHKGDRRSRQTGLVWLTVELYASSAICPDAPARSLTAGTWTRAIASLKSFLSKRGATPSETYSLVIHRVSLNLIRAHRR